MLVDVPTQLTEETLQRTIETLGKLTTARIERLEKGIYEDTGSPFGFSFVLKDNGVYKDDYFSIGDLPNYGVCDNYQQIIARYPRLVNSPKDKFVIGLTRISRSGEPPKDGWRWHKWGPYIGTQIPTREYLYDEPEIEGIYLYHIYQLSPLWIFPINNSVPRRLNQAALVRHGLANLGNMNDE